MIPADSEYYLTEEGLLKKNFMAEVMVHLKRKQKKWALKAFEGTSDEELDDLTYL